MLLVSAHSPLRARSVSACPRCRAAAHAAGGRLRQHLPAVRQGNGGGRDDMTHAQNCYVTLLLKLGLAIRGKLRILGHIAIDRRRGQMARQEAEERFVVPHPPPETLCAHIN